MIAGQQSLRDFANACRRRFGPDVAHCNDEGAFVTLKDATVHVRLDLDADRVVFWTDVVDAAGVPPEAVEQAAMDYVSERFFVSGFVMGVSRGAGLVVLGRSCASRILGEPDALEIVEELEREAQAAASWIKAAFAATRRQEDAACEPEAVLFRA